MYYVQVGRANPRTRQLLADILTVQNQAVLAVEEYQQVLADDTAERDTKQSAADKCASLLYSMGYVLFLYLHRHVFYTHKILHIYIPNIIFFDAYSP